VLSALLFTVYAFPYAEVGLSERWFRVYLSGYARVAGAVLSLFGARVEIRDNVIQGACSLRIVKTCDAMEANILFAAAVLAFPSAWNRKLLGAGTGLAILVVLNVARICTLYAVGARFPAAFDFLHEEMWPFAMTAIAATMFFLWAAWTRRRESSAPLGAV
jgi:exosortase/archaeosortase family protein